MYLCPRKTMEGDTKNIGEAERLLIGTSVSASSPSKHRAEPRFFI